MVFTIPKTELTSTENQFLQSLNEHTILFPILFGKKYYELTGLVTGPSLSFKIPKLNIEVDFKIPSIAAKNNAIIDKHFTYCGNTKNLIIKNYGFLTLTTLDIDLLDSLYIKHKIVFVGLTPAFGRQFSGFNDIGQVLELI